MATIATHNGSEVHQAHNRREKRCVEKEEHINPQKVHENWIDESLKDAYHRLFDAALEKYNAKQTREDRKIKNYLSHVDKDAKMNTAYELIIGVYGDDVSAQKAKSIMKEFVRNWNERNPSLELIGAYYHNDEQGQKAHVHIDYIPIARDYKKGLEIQPGLNKALEQQGIEKGFCKTLQIAWEKKENKALEEICNKYDIEVEHPMAGKEVKHLETKAFKLTQKVKELEATIDNLEEEYRMRSRIDLELSATIEKKKALLEEMKEEIVDTSYDLIDRLQEAENRYKASKVLKEIEEEKSFLKDWTTKAIEEDIEIEL